MSDENEHEIMEARPTKDYGYTTISLKPEYRKLLEDYAIFHDMKQVTIIHSIIVLFGIINPETREAMLELAEHILEWKELGNEFSFSDELDLPPHIAEAFNDDINS